MLCANCWETNRTQRPADPGARQGEAKIAERLSRLSQSPAREAGQACTRCGREWLSALSHFAALQRSWLRLVYPKFLFFLNTADGAISTRAALPQARGRLGAEAQDVTKVVTKSLVRVSGP
jgi:hypothetical protein